MGSPWERDWEEPAAPSAEDGPWARDWAEPGPAAAEPGGFKASAKQAIGATIKGAGQAAADFLPFVDQDNAVKRYGQEVIDANPTAVRNLEDIADKPWTAVKEATGNAAGSMGAMLGARAVGTGITAAAPLTGPFAPAVALVGQAVAWLGPAAIAALPSFGGIRDKQILNDPDNLESGKAKAVAALGAAAVGAIETRFGPQNWALAAWTKEGRAKLAEKFAATTLTGSVAKGVATGAAVEGAEELVQNPIEQLAAGDDPTTPESIRETLHGGAMGAIGGGVIGGGFGIAGRQGRTEEAKTAQAVQTISAAPDVDTAIAAATEAVAAPVEPAAPISGLAEAGGVWPLKLAPRGLIESAQGESAIFEAVREGERMAGVDDPQRRADVLRAVQETVAGQQKDAVVNREREQIAAAHEESLKAATARSDMANRRFAEQEQTQTTAKLAQDDLERRAQDVAQRIVDHDAKGLTTPTAQAYRAGLVRRLEEMGFEDPASQSANSEQPLSPKTVAGRAVEAHSDAQLQALAVDPATPATTRHAAAAALANRTIEESSTVAPKATTVAETATNPIPGSESPNLGLISPNQPAPPGIKDAAPQVAAKPVAEPIQAGPTVTGDSVPEKAGGRESNVPLPAVRNDTGLRVDQRRPNTLYILGADWTTYDRKDAFEGIEHRGDPVAALKEFEQRNPTIHPQLMVATDENGKPWKVVSPNGKMADYDSADGRYRLGDMDAFRKDADARIEQGRAEGDPDKVNAAADERIADLQKKIASSEAALESNAKQRTDDKRAQKAGMAIGAKDARYDTWKEYHANGKRIDEAISDNLAKDKAELADWESKKVKDVQGGVVAKPDILDAEVPPPSQFGNGGAPFVFYMKNGSSSPVESIEVAARIGNSRGNGGMVVESGTEKVVANISDDGRISYTEGATIDVTPEKPVKELPAQKRERIAAEKAAEPVKVFGKTLDKLTRKELDVAAKKHKSDKTREAAQTEIARRDAERAEEKERERVEAEDKSRKEEAERAEVERRVAEQAEELDRATETTAATIEIPRGEGRLVFENITGGSEKDGTFTIRPARYAKGKVLVQTPSTTGFKSRAARLAGHIARDQYTGREHGYVMSPAQAERFYKLFNEGMDAGAVSNELIPPKAQEAPQLESTARAESAVASIPQDEGQADTAETAGKITARPTGFPAGGWYAVDENGDTMRFGKPDGEMPRRFDDPDKAVVAGERWRAKNPLTQSEDAATATPIESAAKAAVTALRAAADAMEKVASPTTEKPAAAEISGEETSQITDFGEKIGGARKDTAKPTGKTTKVETEESAESGWRKRFAVYEIASSTRPEEVGRWAIRDTRVKGWRGAMVGRETFATKEAAETALPILAVAQKHRVHMNRPGTDGIAAYTIWREVTDRKRVQVVPQEFASREDAMRYMTEHAAEIIEVKTSYGEEILAKPETVNRIGAARRDGPATTEMFAKAFGFRAVEFGNWNNQEERQEVMNHAYDGLLDLAEVMGIPPKAISLNGELALAFGARGQGLVGAKAHYERDYGAINLTKMSGAGSLAHEWFHATDHYFARQDTKAKSEKIKNERGDMVFDASTPRLDFASHGFRMTGSQVREELRNAYTDLIQTMFTKAEQYVEDTQKAEKFVGGARERVAKALADIRLYLTRGPESLTYMKRNNKPASAEQLADFDKLADIAISGEDRAIQYRPSPGSVGKKIGAPGWMAGRQTNDTLEAMSAILKSVRGRSGFNAENTGTLDSLRATMRQYHERIKMLESANAQETKTKRVPTSYAMENKKIDQGRASDYWTTEHEMAARAFSAYVEDKIAEQGNRSDFLAYGSDNNLPWYRLLNVRPFPEGKERIEINKAFDKFVAELQTKETDKGVAMFSRAPAYTTDPSGAPLLHVNGLDLSGPQALHPDFVTDGTAYQHNVMQGDRKLGVAMLNWKDGKVAELLYIKTLRNLRGQGIAERVVSGILSHNEGQSLRAVMVLPEARGFWEKMGAEFVATEDGEDGIVSQENYREARGAREDAQGSGRGADEKAVREGPAGPGDAGSSAGGEALSRRGSATPALPLSDAKAVVASIRRSMPGAPPIHIHERIGQAPSELLAQIRRAGAEGDVEAAFHDGEIHVFPQNIASVERAQFVIGHHEIRHYGLRGLLGPRLGEEMHRIYAQNPAVREATKRERVKYPKLSQAAATEEVLADMPTADVAKLRGIDRLVAAIRSALRSLAERLRRNGLNALADAIEPEAWTDNDVRALIARAEDMARQGDTPFRAGGTALQARRISPTGYKTIRDFVVPETPEYEGNMTGDIAHIPDAAARGGVEALPIRLPVGQELSPHVGQGITHMKANADRQSARAPTAETGDQAEDLARDLLKVLRGGVQVFSDARGIVIRSPSEKRAVVLKLVGRGGDSYYSVVTVRPAENNVWGNPAWLGRLTFPSVSRGGSELPNQSIGEGLAATNPERAGVQTEKFEFNKPGPKVQIKPKPRLSRDPLNSNVAHTSQNSAADQTASAAIDPNAYYLVNADTGAVVSGPFSSRQEARDAVGENTQDRPEKGSEIDASNPDIRFSRSGDAVGAVLQSPNGPAGNAPPQTPPGNAASWDAPMPSRLDNIIYTMQDKQIDARRVLEQIRKHGQVSDAKDVRLQEELYHGRTAKQVDDFLAEELKPLFTEMAARKVAMPELEEYLHARHAEEANEAIARRNPKMPDGGSGMDTADAQAYLAGLDPAKKRAYEALATRVDAINAKTRQTWVDYGLTSQADVDAMEASYKHYVPLHREDMDNGPGLGQGFSVRGPSTKKRTGSKRAVVDILANIAMQREKAIVRGEKNRVAVALVGLAEANPNPDFWEVDQPPKIKYVDDRTGLVTEAIDPMYKSRENVVMARIPDANGEIVEHSVAFSEFDERAVRMAKALKNLDMDDLGQILGMSAKITRYFASVNTQYNPVFGVVNLVRDFQGALLNLSSTELAGKQAEVSKHALSALKGIYIDLRDTRQGKAPTSSWAQLWEEFQGVGGRTGYRDMFRTSKDRAEAIEREISRVTEGKAKQFGRAVFDWLSDYNTAGENAVRLAAYKVGIDNGMTKERAASLAKNLTVNFNRKGQVATQAGALYAFFNASVQGATRLAETLAGPAGRKIIAGGLTLGAVQALALAAAGFGDDEPPEFVRERNIIIPIGGKKYITIPMPLGLHVLPNISRVAAEFALTGFRDPGKRVVQLAGVFTEAFNPIGNAGLSLQTIAPTAIDPIAALAENKDWTGKPIAREDMNKLAPTPGHTRAKDTASAFSKAVSQGLNWISGGTNYKPGMFSPTPDQIDYLIGQATGGIGRETMKAEQTIASAFSGEELPTYKVPLLGRFYGDSGDQSSQANAFYSNLKLLNEHEAEIKGRRKAGEPLGDYFNENPEARLFQIGNKYERAVSQLRKQKRALTAKDASREQIKAVELQMTARMQQLNDQVKRVREARP